MPGFFYIQSSANICTLNHNIPTTKSVNRKITYSNTVIIEDFLNKFEKDKAFFENENYIICFDAVLLNLKDLLGQFNMSSVFNLIIEMYLNIGNDFFNHFRGKFAGILYDKKMMKTIVFNDHMASIPIYKYELNDFIIYSTEIHKITSFLTQNNIKIDISIIGAYSLLSYGYMVSNYTLIEGIHKLSHGTYDIQIKDSPFVNTRYYQLPFRDNRDSLEKRIELIDTLFNKAIKLQIQKNEEYGYYNFAPLSAGMDSRVTNWYLYKNNAPKVINLTYSESENYDQIIPLKLSDYFHNEIIFKTLNNGLSLFDIDKTGFLMDGLVHGAWTSQLYNFLNSIETSKMGIIHTGVLGDVIVDSFVKGETKDRYELGDGAFSKLLIQRLKIVIEESGVDLLLNDFDYEHNMITNRGFNGAYLGYHNTFKYHGEDFSPFMFLDLFDYCMSIPINERKNDFLYYSWTYTKIPEMTKYNRNGLKIHNPSGLKITIRGRKYYLSKLPTQLMNKFKIKTQKNFGMNPYDAWLKNNTKLSEYVSNLYKKLINSLSLRDDLLNDLRYQFDYGNAVEKINVVSFLLSVDYLVNVK